MENPRFRLCVSGKSLCRQSPLGPSRLPGREVGQWGRQTDWPLTRWFGAQGGGHRQLRVLYRSDALYGSVSTSDRGQTIDNQLRPAPRASGRLGWSIVTGRSLSDLIGRRSVTRRTAAFVVCRP